MSRDKIMRKHIRENFRLHARAWAEQNPNVRVTYNTGVDEVTDYSIKYQYAAGDSTRYTVNDEPLVDILVDWCKSTGKLIFKVDVITPKINTTKPVDSTCVNGHGKKVTTTPKTVTISTVLPEYIESRSGKASDFLSDTPVVTRALFNELLAYTKELEDKLQGK